LSEGGSAPQTLFKSAWSPPRLKEHIPSDTTRIAYAYQKQSTILQIQQEQFMHTGNDPSDTTRIVYA